MIKSKLFEKVSAILWSNHYKELISSHGYSNNELIIWKYPGLAKIAELTGISLDFVIK
jgi:cell division cycle protein 20 (cofactor of APC complex)